MNNPTQQGFVHYDYQLDKHAQNIYCGRQRHDTYTEEKTGYVSPICK